MAEFNYRKHLESWPLACIILLGMGKSRICTGLTPVGTLSQQQDPAMALHNEGHLLVEDGDAVLRSVDAEGLLHQAGPQELGDAHTVEMQKSQAELAKPQELQASQDQVAQVSTAWTVSPSG